MQIVRLLQNVLILTTVYCCQQYAQFPVCKFYTFQMTAFVQSFSLKVSRVHVYIVQCRLYTFIASSFHEDSE